MGKLSAQGGASAGGSSTSEGAVLPILGRRIRIRDGRIEFSADGQPPDLVVSRDPSAGGLAVNGAPVVSTLNGKTAALTVTGSTLLVPRQSHSRAALAARYLSAARVVCLGSSTTQGIGATSIDRAWVDRWGTMLHQRLPTPGVVGGRYIPAVDTGWTFTGTQSLTVAGMGLQSRSLSAGATMARTINPCTAVTVLFAQGPGSGTFTVQVDALTPVTVTPNTGGAAGRHDGTYTSPSVAVGSHTVTIAATNACVINGIYFHNGDEASGIQVYNGGRSGAVTSDFAGTATNQQRIGQLAPGLVVLAFGANEFQAQTNPAAFQADLEGLIAGIKAACAIDPGFEIWAQHQRLDVIAPTYPWSQYVAAMAAVADGDGTCRFVDIGQPFPVSMATDVWSVRNADTVHLNDRGHAELADLAIEALTTPVVAPLAVASSADTPFLPSSLPGLLAWWDAGTITGLSNGDPVSTWTPRAGSETAALTQTGTARPTYRTGRIGGLPSLLCVAANSQWMDTGAWAASHAVPLTVIAVFRYTTAVGNLMSGQPGAFVYAGFAGAGTFSIGAGAVADITITETMDVGSAHIVCAVYNGSSSSVRLDKQKPTTTGTTGTSGAATLSRVHFGTNSAGTSVFLDGEVSELLIFDHALTAADASQVMTYLGSKYSLSVS
ncbi:SGNH/GDSL hydrolase family protein [Frankia sp. Mgl5]|uniref:SGNH/GDSL hydrolase family protein n=1 Tax=Frankia sp. Mgl5 TaxID=2933793 RepID=UPI00200E3908|nr:SGNH/GDSL hydrolase family protein [Frankia sp. Mgl5]